MSKKNIIRRAREARDKARDQFQSVREEGLRRQLHAVKGSSKRSSSGTQNAAATPGFKFSEIDNTDMDDFEWLRDEDDTRSTDDSASATGSLTDSLEDPREDHTETADDGSNEVGSGIVVTADSSQKQLGNIDTITATSTTVKDKETDSCTTAPIDHHLSNESTTPQHHTNKTTNHESSKLRSTSLFDDGPSLLDTAPTNDSNKLRSASLFDDAPSLLDTGTDDDLFSTNNRVKPPLTTDTLFDPSPIPVRKHIDPLDTRSLHDNTSGTTTVPATVEGTSNAEGTVEGGTMEGLFDHHSDNREDWLEEDNNVSQPQSTTTDDDNKPDSITQIAEISSHSVESVPVPDIHISEDEGDPPLNKEVIIKETITSEQDTVPQTISEPTELNTDHTNEDNNMDSAVPNDDDDDYLFQSATNQLLLHVEQEHHSNPGGSSNENKPDLNSSFELTLSEVSEDPLSMMSDDPMYDSSDDLDETKKPIPSQDDDSLLPISESHFKTDQTPNHTPTTSHAPSIATNASNVPPPRDQSTASTQAIGHSYSPRGSPSTIRKSPLASPNTLMKRNRSGKRVPVVPPRPHPITKRTTSAPTDSDTVSLSSNASSVSAYSADEVLNRRGGTGREGSDTDSLDSTTSSMTSSSMTSSVFSRSGLQYQTSHPWLLDSITESAVESVSVSIPPTHPSLAQSNGYTVFTLLSMWLFLYVYYSLNPFAYLAGFLAGFFLFYITIGTAFYWYVQYSEREKERREAANKKVELPALEDLPKTINTDFESDRILESKKFGMVRQYYPATHHPSQRVNNTKVKLYDDFMMEVRYRNTIQTPEGLVSKEVVLSKDLRECSVLIVPEEVAQNRKRRWSKKFPISITWDKTSADSSSSSSQVFLFPFTSREKEEWFRRMRFAQEGNTYDNLIEKQTVFFRYMGKYMPHSISPQLEPSSSTRSSSNRPSSHKQPSSETKSHVSQRTRSGTHRHGPKLASEPVRFSMTNEADDDMEDDTVVSISNDTQSTKKDTKRSLTHKHQPPPLPPNPPPSSSLTYGWMNAGLARLAWDLWHEERWLKWVQSRIQRKLIRIKTPSFMEPLKVTAVDMGMDMPIIKKPFKNPKLDSRGIWVYMEVEYHGTFNMTIETKLKLEPKFLSTHFNRGNSESPPPSRTPNSSSPIPDYGGPKPHPYYNKSRISRLRVGGDPEDHELSSGSDDEDNTSSHLTKSIEEKLPLELEQQGIPVYGSSQDDSGLGTSSSSSSSVTSSSEYDPTSTNGPKGKKEKILTNMVSRLQKIATKSKFVAKAAEKVSSYPMILSVEVKSLKGFLVLNMAPPPSDALWFGFTVNPVLDLVAKPKLGHRQVTLSYVTDWIEKKLCDVVEKKLVYPNMEDLVIPLLNSGLPEDKLTDLMTSPS